MAALLGVAGCTAAIWAISLQTGFDLYVGDSLVLANGGGVAVAQAGILVLPALTLVALVQVSVCRLLTYSAIAHAGYVLLGVATIRV